MYRLLVERVRNNPLTGGVQYKCISCRVSRQIDFFTYPNEKMFYMTVNQPHRIGTYINPRKALGI